MKLYKEEFKVYLTEDRFYKFKLILLRLAYR
jgi:hypothetical protein